MGLKDIGETLPPGFRFYPSDEELVCHYLFKKITNEELLKGTLVEIDLHICEPWQLPEVAKLNANEWYFFSFRDRKYATGFRTNRATTTGYWKATGKDRLVLDPKTRKVVGMRKTLVFYRNRAPNGIKTGWIMHEFRLETPHMPPKEDWVLCRVFHKHKGETSNSPNNSHQNPHLFMEVTSTTGTGGTSSPPLIVPSPTHQIYHHQTYNSKIAAAYHDKSTNSFTSNPIRHEIIQTNHINSSAPLKLGLLNSDDTAVQLLNGNGDEATANNYPSSISSIMQVIGKNNCNGRDQAGDDHQNNIHQQYGSLLWDMNLDDDNNNSGLGEGFQQQQQQNHHHSYHYQLIGDVCSFEDHDGIVLL